MFPARPCQCCMFSPPSAGAAGPVLLVVPLLEENQEGGIRKAGRRRGCFQHNSLCCICHRAQIVHRSVDKLTARHINMEYHVVSKSPLGVGRSKERGGTRFFETRGPWADARLAQSSLHAVNMPFDSVTVYGESRSKLMPGYMCPYFCTSRGCAHLSVAPGAVS